MDKQQDWAQISQSIEETTDTLGLPIDAGIKDVVIALNAVGLSTSSSCEGHLDWGRPYPWVEIEKEALTEEMFRQLDSRKPGSIEDIFEQFPNIAALRDANVRCWHKALDLLTEFYQLRDVPESRRIITCSRGVYGAFEIIPQGGEVQVVLSPIERRGNLVGFQTEMQAFADFLKNRFFEGVHADA